MSFILKNIKVEFEEFNALTINYVEIPTHKTTWVTGQNGAGKTTFLKLLAGLITPKTGAFTYNYKNLITKKNYMDYRQKTTLLSQEPYLFRGTVFKNVMYGLNNRGFTKKQLKTKALNAMEQTGVLDLSNRDSKHLSVGEKKRVALARCIAIDCETILLDEPLAGLDEKSVAQITNLIKKLSQLKKTLIISTHNYDNTKNKNDLCIHLESGKIQSFSNER
tara:strand:- start:6032 stop:6691 length:660 start_codon:yes stop_codon:yes gene_type:complete